tara:strand:- start:739 stop:930 length:192 start_codon:yes stop_codon:yes gene_type:complete
MPMQTFTRLDFLQLTSKEKKLKSGKLNNEKSPKQQTINNILNYSKALSIRDSKHLKHIEMVLN